MSSEAILSLLNIEKLFDELATCRDQLLYHAYNIDKDYEIIFERYKQDLNLHLAFEVRQHAVAQVKAFEELSWLNLVLLISPVHI
ncbi:hypothetical protein GQ53DRAFT_750630 [Thozetella sp. PMI_491]|nr:hypothetical protein GQ53DRAFT_750630 [Thozetella sp. PMI_491]